MGELKKVFRPELLAIDEVIVFYKLTKDEIKTDRRPDDEAAQGADGGTQRPPSRLWRRRRSCSSNKGYDPV